MHIVVKADDQQRDEFLSKPIAKCVMVTFLSTNAIIPEGDVYFDLLFEEQGACFGYITDKPVFVNAVITTCDVLPGNSIRINAWTGFLNREIIEVSAADPQILAEASQILHVMEWKYQLAPDLPGMISARVIAMIINEAYFGLGDEISTKAEIDIAMKLGTNYPYGPFEWSKKIGLPKIYALLKKMYETDSRYAVAPALEKEIVYK